MNNIDTGRTSTETSVAPSLTPEAVTNTRRSMRGLFLTCLAIAGCSGPQKVPGAPEASRKSGAANGGCGEPDVPADPTEERQMVDALWQELGQDEGTKTRPDGTIISCTKYVEGSQHGADMHLRLQVAGTQALNLCPGKTTIEDGNVQHETGMTVGYSPKSFYHDTRQFPFAYELYRGICDAIGRACVVAEPPTEYRCE